MPCLSVNKTYSDLMVNRNNLQMGMGREKRDMKECRREEGGKRRKGRGGNGRGE
jgi:hypothetical protein